MPSIIFLFHSLCCILSFFYSTAVGAANLLESQIYVSIAVIPGFGLSALVARKAHGYWLVASDSDSHVLSRLHPTLAGACAAIG